MWKVASQSVPSTLFNEKKVRAHFKQVDSYTLRIKVGKDGSNQEIQDWLLVKGSISASHDLSRPLKMFVLKERLIGPGDSRSVPDVAIAACVKDGNPTGLFYNSLPFEAACGLPVSLHGRFAMSPDRRSLRTDGQDGEWNKFLAQISLPRLYFILLERLVTVYPDVNHYTFWPCTSVKMENEISSALQVAFWEQILRCHRKLFLTASNTPVPISQAVFDTRSGAGARSSPDSVVSLINRAKSGSAIVNSAVVIRGLNVARNSSNFVCLTPEYVRNLLRESSVEAILNELSDGDLKSILLFVTDQRSIDALVGCYILRRIDGKITKVAKDGTACGLRRAKRMYVTDQDGLKLFKDIAADCIISPRVLDRDVLARLDLEPTCNVSRLDGAAVDLLLGSVFSGEGLVRTFSKEESEWLSRLYDYVTSRRFIVSSYNGNPMLPLSNKGGQTFVSIAFWNDPRLLPPVHDQNQRRIIEQFPDLYILANLNLDAIKARVTVSAAHCFLLYLYILVRDKSDVDTAVDKLLQEKNLSPTSKTDIRNQLERLLREEKMMTNNLVRKQLEKLLQKKKLNSDASMEVGPQVDLLIS